MTGRYAVVGDICEGHALCTGFAPAVFELDDDEQAHAPDGPLDPDQVPAVERAIAACPVQAIRMEESA